MPPPLQPFLHDLVSQVAAPTQVWSTADGQVRPRTDGAAGVLGLLHGDVRVLSGIEVAVDGDPGVPVAHRRQADGSVVFTSLLRQLDAAHARTGDPHVRLDRVRRVEAGRLSEELVLGSTLDVEVAVTVEVRLTPDASPMELVRTGRPRVAVTLDPARGGAWSSDGIEVEVRAPDASTAVEGEQLTLRWAVTVPAHGSVRVGWTADADRPRPGRGRGAAGPRRRDACCCDPEVDQRLGRLAGTFRRRPGRADHGAARQPRRRLLRRRRPLVLHALRPRQPVGRPAEPAPRAGRRPRHPAHAGPAAGPRRRPADRRAAGQDPARAPAQRVRAERHVPAPALLRHGRRHPAVGLPAARRLAGRARGRASSSSCCPRSRPRSAG